MYPLGDWTVNARERNCLSNGSSSSSRASNCETDIRDVSAASGITESHQQYMRDSLSEEDELMSDDSGQVDSEEDDTPNRYRKSSTNDKMVTVKLINHLIILIKFATLSSIVS